MSAHYHTHALADLSSLGSLKQLAAPDGKGLLSRLLRSNDPFHHVEVLPFGGRSA
jgi:hypothetical protein